MKKLIVVFFLILPFLSLIKAQEIIENPEKPLNKESGDDIGGLYEFDIFLSFLVKNGRAILFPVYQGTFERRDDVLRPIVFGDNSHLYTEYLIQVVKDFKRCVDYLETRQDIDSNKLAFYGMCWGASMGTIISAVEERLAASVLLSGGLKGDVRPEAAQINYITRVKTPTLMLNGEYDTIFPSDTSTMPMFNHLGTPDEHKELKLFKTDHIPPRNEFIKETLIWLDRYLGPVNR